MKVDFEDFRSIDMLVDSEKNIVIFPIREQMGTVIFWYCFCASSKRNILIFKRCIPELLSA